MQNAEGPTREERSAFCILHSAFVVILAAAVLFATPAFACAVCYGNPNDPMVKSADNATLFLLGTVIFVQIGFVALFWTLWRRAKALRKHRDQFHVIHGGVR